MSEEFDYGKGGRGVSEDFIEIRGIQFDGVVVNISVVCIDGTEDRARSPRGRRSGECEGQRKEAQNQKPKCTRHEKLDRLLAAKNEEIKIKTV